MKQIYLTIAIFLFCSLASFSQSKGGTLSSEGAWYSYASPSGIFHKGEKGQTYFSWINKNGELMIASMNHITGNYSEKKINNTIQGEKTDNPVVLVRQDGKLIVFYAKNETSPLHKLISTKSEDISSWETDYTFSNTMPYAFPFQSGDKMYIVYQGSDGYPEIISSTDDGNTFGVSQKLIQGGTSVPQVRYCMDKTGNLHLVFTKGNPQNEAANKIYYACFKNGNFYKANGSLIKTYSGTSTALTPEEAETVFVPAGNKCRIGDATVDNSGKPVVVCSSFSADADHNVKYICWNGTNWVEKQITTGVEITATEGGITLDYAVPSVVYLSKPGKTFFKYSTGNNGDSWTETAISEGTISTLTNVRPFVPFNHQSGVFEAIWDRETFILRAGYEMQDILVSPESLKLTLENNRQLSVTFYPNSGNKTLTWKSSDESIAIVSSTGLVTSKGKGTAIISATNSFGNSSFCSVEVIAPMYLENVFFDFGTATSPVASGAIQVTETTMLADSYGWLTTGVRGRDKSAVSDPELRDFCIAPGKGQEGIFKVFVRPGTYKITTKHGDNEYLHDQMNIDVNGVRKSTNINSAKGAYTTVSFEVTTTVDYLEFKLTDDGGDDNWVINSLKIEKLANDIPSISLDDFMNPETIVAVFDLLGKKVFEEKLGYKTYDKILEDKNLTKRVYLVQFRLGNQTKTIKFLSNH